MKYKTKKRAYYVFERDEDFGVAVVAYNPNKAKSWVFQYSMFDFDEYIDMRIRKIDVNVDDLQVGEIEIIKAFKLGIYSHILSDCAKCKSECELYLEFSKNDKFYCEDCFYVVEGLK